MSSNWPALLQGNLTSGLPVEKHRHDANDISGNLGDVLVGDIRSFNWNGGSDLSGGPTRPAPRATSSMLRPGRSRRRFSTGR